MIIQIESHNLLQLRKFKKSLTLPDVSYGYFRSTKGIDLISDIACSQSNLRFEVEGFKERNKSYAMECFSIGLDKNEIIEILKRLGKISFTPLSAIEYLDTRGVCDHSDVIIKISSKRFNLEFSSDSKVWDESKYEIEEFLSYIDFLIGYKTAVSDLEILTVANNLFEGEISDDEILFYIRHTIKDKLLKSEVLQQAAFENKKNFSLAVLN